MNCPNCQESVNHSARFCSSCGHDVGFPNVRAATTPAESIALQRRAKDARVSTRARNCHEILNEFATAVSNSKAIICQNIGEIQRLVSDETQLYSTYYQQVNAESRIPTDNRWDRGRNSVDSTLFPNYHAEIRFAALTLNNRGLFGHYGRFAMILKDKMIANRASVFEENPFLFCDRHGIVVSKPIPPGCRAAWDKRHLLAIAKLHSAIAPTTTPSDFPGILLAESPNGNDDFIEVHIFGAFNCKAIERVIAPRPSRSTERSILKSLRSKLRRLNVPIEEY